MTTPTRADLSWWCRRESHKGCPADYEDMVCGCECHGREVVARPDGTWQIELPISTPLSLNDRSHWSVKGRQVAALRRDAGWCAREAKIARCRKIKVTLIYEPRNERRRDKDNLVATLKPVVDGLVDVGVIPDDTPEHIEYDMPLIDVPNGKRGRLIVIVERVL